ncbi:MAG TPA: amidohydrolase family protein, partial [Terriglobales bacterium]
MLRTLRWSISALAGVVAVLVGISAAQPGNQKSEAADLLITNAKVYTVNARQPWAEAIAIRGDRIVFVGETRNAARFRSATTKIIDAGGRLVLPGIQDSHVHFVSGSRDLQTVDLDGAKTIEEMQRRIRTFAKAHPEESWIQGRGWMY